MHQQEVEQQLVNLDNLLDQVDEIIMSLPLRSAVKNQLTKHVYELYSEVEQCLDVTPVDWD
jgi:hypothetical protein